MRRLYILIIICGCALSSATTQDANMSPQRSYLENLEQFPISNFTIRLLRDEELRDSIFPSSYSMDVVTEQIKKENFIQAAWSLIRLYESDQMSVLQSVKAFSQHIEIDGLFIKAFDEYAYADPHIMKYIDGIPILMEPENLKKYGVISKSLQRLYRYYKLKS